ncbi:hypothetical protein RND71_030066 [Anisodus tanguticus]|uniref:Uncharacterized protein n=1 Tax=Anisodus tanguticus TaxID=243964 RepID=A0AAE1UZB6_9SOLA|nr:hypothetical protein RND71_030066 [Anisodus tanguticus]
MKADYLANSTISAHASVERLTKGYLLRFKRVSKFWKTLIFNPYFKKMHQSHAMNSKKLLVSQWCPDKEREYMFYYSPVLSVQQAEDVEKLDRPSTYESLTCNLYCYCNGTGSSLSCRTHFAVESLHKRINRTSTFKMHNMLSYLRIGI